MLIGKRNGFWIALILVLFTGLSSCHKVASLDWDSYTSKDKLFKIQFPPTWNHQLAGHVFNITPLKGTGLVAVSGYVDPGTTFDEQAFKDMVMLDFVECRVKEPFKPSHGNNWTGEDALYERTINGQKFIYLFRVAHRGQVGAFVAVSDIEIHMKTDLENYKKIMDSLVILDNPTETEDLSNTKPVEKKKRPWQEALIDWLRSTEKKEPSKSYYSN
jgi:hypothetical protein